MTVAVYIITGFLGSGKTTLLRRLIDSATGRKIAVIINEFGKEGIDAHLIPDSGFLKFELNHGSLFCVCLRDDFIETLIRAADEGADLILVEATGVADVKGMKELFNLSAISSRARLYKNICLVDSSIFEFISKTLAAASEQVSEADLILLNKTDLAGEEKTARSLALCREINPRAEIVKTSFCNLPKGKIIIDDNPAAADASLKADSGGAASDEPGDMKPYMMFSETLKIKAPVDFDKFREVMQNLPISIYRAKGFIATQNGDYYFSITKTAKNYDRWEKFKITEGVVVLIGSDIKKDFAKIKDALSSCGI